jgi:aspartyl-tRNA(Asn)/glutamyl-tRNA(Gln) amidotransferase subunit A
MRYGARKAGKDLTDTYEQTRAAGFGAEVQRRVLIGAYVLSAGYYDAYYLRAQKVRQRIAEDFRNAWQKCDAILTPTAPSAAFGLGEKSGDPIQMYLNDIFTVTTNLAGLPGLSLPCGVDAKSLPARWKRPRTSAPNRTNGGKLRRSGGAPKAGDTCTTRS